MKIYRLLTNYENTALWDNYKNVKSQYFPNGFKGDFLHSWGEVEITFQNKKKRDSISSLSELPVFSEKAFKVLTPFLDNHIQVLPLKNPDLFYYAINVTNVIDAIDYNLSDLEKLADGRTIEIKNHVFKKQEVINQHIFKTPELPTLFVYVSDRFRQAVIDNRLSGFNFVELWDSEATNYKDCPEPIEWRDPIASEVLTFSEAMSFAENNGQVYRSGRWRLKFNKKGNLEIGEANKIGQIYYDVLVNIPPILLTQKWYLDK
jgi:hypothetical protein